MFWDGGITKMIQMSSFLNSKIYKRFVEVRSVFCPVPDSFKIYLSEKRFQARFWRPSNALRKSSRNEVAFLPFSSCLSVFQVIRQ